MEQSEKMRYLTQRVIEVFLERLEKEIPERGNFTKISVSVNLLGTENKGVLWIEASKQKPDARYLWVSARREGGDLLVSHYLLANKTNSEIREYLSQEEMPDRLLEEFMQLSNAVEDKMA